MNKILLATLLALTTATSATAGDLGLTRSNGHRGSHHTGRNCESSLGLTRSNHSRNERCSNKIKLENQTGFTVYYDLDYATDEGLRRGGKTTWSIRDNDSLNRGYSLLTYDRNLRRPGIQSHTIRLYMGDSYYFKRSGDILKLHRVGN